MLFPNILAVGSGGGNVWKFHAYQMRVPIDDQQSMHYWYIAYEPPADVEVPRAPKKAGAFATSVVLSFVDTDGQVLSRIVVPVVLAISEEGAAYDASRGSAVTLVVRRNLVEVRVPGVATVDCDVGDPVPVQIRSSGRLLHARLISKDEALATEAPR